MELRQLEHFLAVAEERHFTRAAELLRISQSGLSASIRALETELGAALFTRSTRRVELTQAGKALLEESVRTVASATAAREAVAAIRDVLRGTLNVGTEECLGVVDLPKELAEFRARHPGVRIRLGFRGSARLVDDFSVAGLDLALVAVCGPIPQGLRFQSLSTEPFVMLCHPDHPLAGRDSVAIGELGDQTFVGFEDGWAATVLVSRAFAAAAMDHRVELEVNDVHTLLDLVGYGLGIAIVPEHFARKRPDRLRAVPLSGPAPEWEIGIVTHEHPGPAAQALLAQLQPERAATRVLQAAAR